MEQIKEKCEANKRHAVKCIAFNSLIIKYYNHIIIFNIYLAGNKGRLGIKINPRETGNSPNFGLIIKYFIS